MTASSALIACCSSLSLRSQAGCQALVSFASQRDCAAEEARGRAHALDDVGAVHALSDGHDFVEREGALEERLERELERLALELLRALLELALEIGGLALRRFELRLPLRLAAGEVLGRARARLLLDFLALGVELALVLEVRVPARLFGLAELAAKGELFVAELGEGALLRAQGLVQRADLRIELGLRRGGELGFHCLSARGERAVELLGVALDCLAGDAFGKREAVAALRAGHLLFCMNDDVMCHGYLPKKFGVRAQNQAKARFGL